MWYLLLETSSFIYILYKVIHDAENSCGFISVRLMVWPSFQPEGTKWMCTKYKIINSYECLKSDLTNLWSIVYFVTQHIIDWSHICNEERMSRELEYWNSIIENWNNLYPNICWLMFSTYNFLLLCSSVV